MRNDNEQEDVMSTELRAIPLEEATRLEPGETEVRPWNVAEAIDAIVSDSLKWDHWPKFDYNKGHRCQRIAQSAIENLYRCGFVIARAPDSEEGGAG